MSRISLRVVVELIVAVVVAVVLVPWMARVYSARASWTDGPAPAPPLGHAVVVTELFTSEGCSSCPPADAVLSTLVHEQPLQAVEVIGLGEHVDYWDRLGWRDPYSSAAFSARQSDYSSRVFRSGDVYTPQLVVDGRYQAVGSDIRQVRDAIVRAASEPKARVDLSVIPSTSQIDVQVNITPQRGVVLRGTGDVILAVTQDRLADDVARGENNGRRLTHTAVVRRLTAIGSVPGPIPATMASATLSLAPQWTTSDLRVVAFLQERDSRRIVGAASTTLGHSTLKENSR